MSMFKVWNLTKTRGERLGVAAVYGIDGLVWIARLVPYGLAYMAGVGPIPLVSVYAAVYALCKGGVTMARHVGEMIAERQVRERATELDRKIRDLFAQEAARAPRRDPFAPPPPSKIGGVN